MLKLLNILYKAFPAGLRQGAFRGVCRMIRPFDLIARVDGIRYHLDLGEMIDVALLLRKFEPHTTDAFRRLVKPGWTIIDIGANIGAHALTLARLTGPDGLVFAFEPTDYGFSKLSRNIALNQFPHLYPVKMALSNENLVARPVLLQSSWPTVGPPKITPSMVEYRRLDDWNEEHELQRVDLIKLDVDGHEYEVLDGGRRLLTRCRPALLTEAGLYHFASPARNPLGLLCSIGYRFFDERTLAEFPSLKDIEHTLKQSQQTINLIATCGEPEWARV